MASTPEGKVKDKIKAVLAMFSDFSYYYMPVPSGYGKPSLDFIGSARVAPGAGLAFAIEAKRPKKGPTTRQEGTIEAMQVGGVRVFRINDEAGCAELREWLTSVTGGDVT